MKSFLVLQIIMQLPLLMVTILQVYLIKTREGRPIKIESNSLQKQQWYVNARVQASVLDLYDNQRLKAPQKYW